MSTLNTNLHSQVRMDYKDARALSRRSLERRLGLTRPMWHSTTIENRARTVLRHKWIVTCFCRVFDADTAFHIDKILMSHLSGAFPPSLQYATTRARTQAISNTP